MLGLKLNLLEKGEQERKHSQQPVQAALLGAKTFTNTVFTNSGSFI